MSFDLGVHGCPDLVLPASVDWCKTGDAMIRVWAVKWQSFSSAIKIIVALPASLLCRVLKRPDDGDTTMGLTTDEDLSSSYRQLHFYADFFCYL
jgi:hypothetical protein